eukprot:COSAG01_NODE_32733_length_576_cov_1.176101_1_plen_35_part_10
MVSGWATIRFGFRKFSDVGTFELRGAPSGYDTYLS